MKVSTENLNVKVKFMHPKLPTLSLKWPSRDNLCWVPNVHVCRVVSPPELSSQKFNVRPVSSAQGQILM